MAEENKGRLRNRNYCKKFERKGKFLNARESTCCAWTQFRVLEKRDIIGDHMYCGLTFDEMEVFKMKERKNAKKEARKRDFKEEIRPTCCKDEMVGTFGDCDSFNWPKGPAMVKMLEYANSNDEFYRSYLKAWKVATENGWKLTQMDVDE